MNIREIEALLEKFYEGQTTLEEEHILRSFFCSNDVPENLKEHQPFFIYAKRTHTETIGNPDFDLKLNERLSQPTKTGRMIPWQTTGNKLMFISSIAAAALLLIGLYFTFQHEIFKNSSHGLPLSAQELAYNDARQALLLISANLNTGIKQVERLQYINKAMHNAALLNKFYQYQTIIINPDPVNQQSIKSKQP